jgi:hypothetical protein
VGNKNHWLGVRAKSAQGRYALGATVTVISDGARRNRVVQRAYSYAASNDPRVLVGLRGAGGVEDVIVKWLNGKSEHFGPQQADRYIDLVEGKGRPDRVGAKR